MNTRTCIKLRVPTYMDTDLCELHSKQDFFFVKFFVFRYSYNSRQRAIYFVSTLSCTHTTRLCLQTKIDHCRVSITKACLLVICALVDRRREPQHTTT